MSFYDRTIARLQGYNADKYGDDERRTKNRRLMEFINFYIKAKTSRLEDKINRFPKNTSIIPDANDVNKWMHSDFIKLYKNK